MERGRGRGRDRGLYLRMLRCDGKRLNAELQEQRAYEHAAADAQHARRHARTEAQRGHRQRGGSRPRQRRPGTRRLLLIRGGGGDVGFGEQQRAHRRRERRERGPGGEQQQPVGCVAACDAGQDAGRAMAAARAGALPLEALERGAPGAAALVAAMLSLDPARRPTAAAVARSPVLRRVAGDEAGGDVAALRAALAAKEAEVGRLRAALERATVAA